MNNLYVKLLVGNTKFKCLRSNWELYMECRSAESCPDGFVPLILAGMRPPRRDGYVVGYDCELTGEGLVRTYVELTEDESKHKEWNPPRKWTRLSMKRALAAAGKWDIARSAMETLGIWDEFLMCDFIAEDDPSFVSAYDAVCAKYGKDEIDAFLDTVPAEA